MKITGFVVVFYDDSLLAHIGGFCELGVYTKLLSLQLGFRNFRSFPFCNH